VDVAIVGAGVVGASIAYWLTRLDPTLKVALVERDPTFARASSQRSASSIRQQFSSAVNIRMSQFGLRFLREAHEALAVDGDAPAIGLVEPGYLYLATAAQADALRAQNAVQRAHDAPIALLDPDALAARYPWLAVDDLALGALGAGAEGWFDGPALHAALLRKARAQGARLVVGEVVGVETGGASVSGTATAPDGAIGTGGEIGNGAVRVVDGASRSDRASREDEVRLASARTDEARHGSARASSPGAGGTPRATALRLADGARLACGHVVIAAGAWSRQVAALAGVALPVHARRRTVFVLSCPTALPGCPLVVDPTGFWFRPEGRDPRPRTFIGGTTPAHDEDDLPLEPDLAEFDEALWAAFARRVPAFEALRVERAWAGYYEMNLWDHNALLGAHPAVDRLWFATGFSGHGIQQAPAAGLGIAECVLHGGWRSLDLSDLSVARLAEGRRVIETNVIG
jgi:glycine/D-amino acid oxidase-like deaminating enzyme